ncbi:MAG: DUF3667 domain-containing protein [Bacteroidota bacterium]
MRSDFSYCPTCGAKIIRNRLTLKNVWQDLSFQVFNLDNTFLKTFRHLFTQPDVVIESFVTGARKKYMNPVSYFAIAITLSGLVFYVLRNWYGINLTENNLNPEASSKMDFVLDYQGLLSYIIMPIYALMTWVLFLDIKKLNYTEHLIANAYTTAQVSFVQFLICLPLFGFFDVNYQNFNWFYLLFSVFFQFYAFKKVHKIGVGSTILRGLAYLVMFIIVFMGIGVVILFLGVLTGNINLEDFRPK